MKFTAINKHITPMQKYPIEYRVSPVMGIALEKPIEE